MKDIQQREAARKFAEAWKDKGEEKQDTQKFWLSLLHDVLGVEKPQNLIEFEKRIKLKHTNFIDAHIASTRVLIEQKGIDINPAQSTKQSDGIKLTPFQQAKRYANEMPLSQHPRWIVVCNFRSFWVYDMEHPNDAPEIILLENLETEIYRLQFLTDEGNTHIKQEMEVSLKAGEIVAALYDEILKQYLNPESPTTLHSLNVLCVRLVFCLYAEDAGVFDRHGMFHDYLLQFTPDRMRAALIDLFKVLDTPVAERDPYMDESLKAFPYVNGGLFSDNNIEIPRFNDQIARLLLQKASDDFDWSKISPTIFGAVFESTLNPVTRREGGMHYTSIENIHKVIDPLFLDDLRKELEEIQTYKTKKVRNDRLKSFQSKLAALTFFDPACGSGNFLTETFLSIRRLENEVIQLLTDGQGTIGEFANPIKVSIQQFYGIEINDFAVTVATTALWIAEAQMMAETEKIVQMNLDFLPLKSYTNIHEGNALRMDWEEVIPRQQLDYLMGNPPFTGARIMNEAQKEDFRLLFDKKWKNTGDLDYVCGWYKKAADLMQGTAIRAALVSTNSITQGEQVALLWKPLAEAGIHIDFAYRTFQWDSESKTKAHVHCVIIGFSATDDTTPRQLFMSEQDMHEAKHINGYLLDMEDVFVESRSKALCDVPRIGMGNQPIDGGNYLFTEEEKEAFIRKEPASAPYFKLWYGSYEFINRKPRYCLWLGDCSPAELRKMPNCLKRVEAVRNLRLASKRKSTSKLADKPTRFQTENMPKTTSILIPKVSSERRKYIPIGFMQAGVLCSDLVFLIPEATLYHFGILTSSAHMIWVQAVCGRMKSDYRYSKEIVYNNFAWPHSTEAQQKRIEQTAQAILDARNLYPDSSLADLYDDVTMPSELREAHRRNDRAVMEAYGLSATESTETDCLRFLLELYKNYK